MTSQIDPDQDLEAGFTLVEMLVALSIIAMAALAMNLSVLPGRRSASPPDIARSIVNLAAQVQLTAVTAGKTSSLIISIQDRKISSDNHADSILIPEEVIIDARYAAQLAGQDGSLAIRFYPDGSSSGGEIGVGISGESMSSARIDWLTGAISLGTSGP